MNPRQRARRKTRRRVALVVVLFILAVLTWFVVIPYIKGIMPGNDRADLRAHLGLTGAEDVAVMLGDSPSSSKAIVRGGIVYWDYDSVLNNFSELFWLNIEEGILLFTTADEVVRANADESFYTRHAEAAPASGVVPETVDTDLPVFFVENGKGYISLNFALQFSNFTFELFKEPYRVQIYAEDAEYDSATVLKNTQLRIDTDIKSGILSDLSIDDTVYLIEKIDGWSKVRTNDALIGYVENKRISSSRFVSVVSIEEDFVLPPYTSLTEERKLCIAWHQVSVADANAYLSSVVEKAWSLDVVSPTWYKVADGSGTVTSLAWRSYVNEAHARGLKVWPLVDDFTDGLDRTGLLMSTDNRNRFVSYMISQARDLGFDGINLDFEVVPEEAALGFEQLLRELSVACRAHGLVFSVDNYPPREWTEHYNRRLQGQVADYVIIMGYDEHWGTSSGAGSVASLPFVVDAIEQTIAVVPANKVINAVPFYSRLWATNQVDDSLRISATPGMAWQDRWLSEHEIEPVWDEVLGQNFAEYTRDNVLYQMWLEDMDSMQTRIDAMQGFGLGGVAGWRLGLEKPEVWNILGAYTRG